MLCYAVMIMTDSKVLRDIVRELRYTDGFLISYAEIYRVSSNSHAQLLRFIDELHAHDKRIMLDSGAYSVFTGAQSITLDDYCRYLDQYYDRYDVVMGFDVIGDMQATMDNYQRMLSRGFNVVPTWHLGSDPAILTDLASATDYLAIGGIAVARSPRRVAKYLPAIEARARASNPNIRLHGFGIGCTILTDIVDWYSVDCSTWVTAMRYGIGCQVTPRAITHCETDIARVKQPLYVPRRTSRTYRARLALYYIEYQAQILKLSEYRRRRQKYASNS